MLKTTYEIMHKDTITAQTDTLGHAHIFFPDLMPYGLYLEETENGQDMDTLVNNVLNFNYWCASRVLTLDRTYAKEILGSIGMKQAVTDKDRAQIALSCRCTTLTDVFWVRYEGEQVSFRDINLYENHLDKAFIDIALRGKQYTVQNQYLARDLSTNGVYPKAWKRTEDGFVLLKDGGDNAVGRELLASRICRCFDVSQVYYEAGSFDGEKVTVSKNITSREYSIVSMEAIEVYCQNHEKNTRQFILELDRHNYYMMNIVDYLVGNTDRHWGNWGVLVDNQDNQPVSLHKLMDFNQSFRAYDTIEGANCQTVFGESMTQKEAAVAAVKEIGLHQTAEVQKSFFQELVQYYDMFVKRLEILYKATNPKDRFSPRQEEKQQ
ncbi:MAG: hypothetical protein K2N87_05720 [Eubacterium sp.]|nr:hypothetical protein [Eubacterium sp.]